MAKHQNVSFGSVSFFEEQLGLSGQALLDSLIGQVHQIGNPDFSEGESWEDVPQSRILAARIIKGDPQYAPSLHPEGYIVVDVEEVA